MAILGPPSPVTISSRKDTSVVATFSHSSSGILERRVMYYDNDPYSTAAPIFRTSSNSNPSSVTITGLKPGASYTIAAAVRNADGWSFPSADVVFTTYASYKVPPAPDAPVLTLIGQDRLRASFTDNGNNNFSILERRVVYGTATNAANGTYKVSPNGNPSVVDITGLVPGTKYYFKSIVRNEPGWSAYSAIVSATMVAGAWVKVNGVWKRAVPYVRVNGVWKIARPWTRIAGVWKEDHS
jgi:hypothetical protein